VQARCQILNDELEFLGQGAFMFIKFLLALSFFHAAEASVRNVKTVVNPRPKGHWITDEARILDPTTFSNLDHELNSLTQKTTAEFAVVILTTIDEGSPKEFATALFNYWHIGKKKNSNGLLLLLVMDQRRIEYETGYGLEGVLPDILLSRILHKYVVPEFQKGDFAAGITNATEKVIDVLSGTANLAEIYVENSTPPPDPILDLIWGALALGIFLLGLYLLRVVFLLLTSKDPFLTYARFHPAWMWAAIIGLLMISAFIFVRYHLALELPIFVGADGLGIVSLIFLQSGVRKFLRNCKRKCAKCSHPMRLLSEADEDPFLDQREIFEESIQSVNYDVWVCDNCKNQRVDRFDGNLVGDFSECKACGAIAEKMVSDEISIPSTTLNAGEGEKTIECLYCHKTRKEKYSIAQQSDSSSSSSFGSSDSGSFSSSSSGGSFGGGDSGGGGAGASW